MKEKPKSKTKEVIALFDELINEARQQRVETPDFYQVHGYLETADEKTRCFSMDDVKTYHQMLSPKVRKYDWAMDKMGGIMRCTGITVEKEEITSDEYNSYIDQNKYYIGGTDSIYTGGIVNASTSGEVIRNADSITTVTKVGIKQVTPESDPIKYREVYYPMWSVDPDPPKEIREMLEKVVVEAEKWDREAPGRLEYQNPILQIPGGKGILHEIENAIDKSYSTLKTEDVIKMIDELGVLPIKK